MAQILRQSDLAAQAGVEAALLGSIFQHLLNQHPADAQCSLVEERQLMGEKPWQQQSGAGADAGAETCRPSPESLREAP